MPIYTYECTWCGHIFDEYMHKNIGKTDCIKCGNTSFKIPSVFNANIFQQRVFADGTKTPEHVRTPKQEKAWLKSQGITYDAPDPHQKYKNKSRRIANYKTKMEEAFKDAYDKTKQGFKLEPKKLKSKKPKNLSFSVGEEK